MEENVYRIRTGAGLDSAGKTKIGPLEFEGRTWLPPLVLAFLGVPLFFMTKISSGSMAWAGLVAAFPLSLCIFWLKTFVLGKPKGYAKEKFRTYMYGKRFNVRPTPSISPENPLTANTRKRSKR